MTNNLSRITAKIFASSASLDTIGQFGSALSGTKVNTQDVAQLQALPAYEDGWSQAVISDKNYPTLEEMNAVLNVMSYQTAYSMQKGLCEWDVNTNYFANTSFCQVNGVWYQSLIDNNIGNNPITSPDAWKELPLTNSANQDLSNLTTSGEAHFANPSLSNLNSTGQNILDSKLNDTQITNCILESPRMVDLELSNGTLTLKAGSKVIIPYGTSAPTMSIGQSLNGGTIVDISWDNSKLFYIVQYNANLTKTTSNTGNGYFMLMGGTANIEYSDIVSSASSDPALAWAIWYDVTENKVKKTGSTPSQYGTTYYSLPFAICNTSQGFSSIEEIFQSIGYIGSTIWCNKGIKCLIPNGRNEDGSLNNTEIKYNSIKTYTFPTTANSSTAYMIMQPNVITWSSGINWNDKTTSLWSFSSEDNTFYYNGSPVLCCTGASISLVNGVITSFNPKTTFKAVDYNDYIELKNSIVPSRQVNYSAGIATTFPSNTLYSYTAPKDGVIFLSGNVNNAYSWITINGVNVLLAGDNAQAASIISITLPVSSGDVVSWKSPAAESTCNFFPYKGGN